MDRKESIVQGKTFAFGVRTVNLYKWLVDTKVPYKIAEQLLRSGTSIGGMSRKPLADIVAKISPLKWVSLTKKRVKPAIGFGYFKLPIT